MSDRIKISIPKTKEKEVKINNKVVKIEEHISVDKIQQIIEDIRINIFYNDNITDKHLLMNIRMMQDIIELCTNIDAENLNEEDLTSTFLSSILYDNIDNLFNLNEYLEKEYDKWIMENSFGIVAQKMPTTSEMENIIKTLSETIEGLPQDKLEMIAKSIVWNNLPTLGQAIAPAENK